MTYWNAFARKIIDKKHIWIVSVFGAVLHNVGQIMIAVLVMGMSVLVCLPFLLVSGCLAGAFTGVCAQSAIHRLKNDFAQGEQSLLR